METFVVGGAVRDRLLGLPVKDRDHVVVGATPEEMLARGFKPVGKDFPVFLHPETREEYALARTERKTAPGYRGFVFHADPTVSLEDDLVRRDLTINAIACGEDGRLIDPHGGRRDLEQGLLRHVSEAFAEDPVRILRLARFAARFERFRVADETMALCQRMVAAGEVDALVPERVWQELSRGLTAPAPKRMFDVLDACGALPRLLPELVTRVREQPPLPLLDGVGEADALPVRWAALWLPPSASGAADAEAVAERYRVPGDCRELAGLAIREMTTLAQAPGLDAAALLALVERSDALRRPERFDRLLRLARLQLGPDAGAAVVDRCQRALQAARAVDAGAVARATTPRGQIPAAVRAARLVAVAAALGR